MGTVFFGPFVGELGWELLFWHGWVRKVSRTHFAQHRKIVASFPGREPLYPHADEFWAHPQYVLDALKSPRSYITDFWRNSLPRPNTRVVRWRYGIIPATESVPVPLGDHRPQDVEPVAAALLNTYKQRLPEDTVYFVPWRRNYFGPDNLEFGASYPESPSKDEDFLEGDIPFQAQQFEFLQPTQRGKEALAKVVPPDQRLICVFPRYRRLRRPDKNWPREGYVQVIQELQRRRPEYTVAILGSPGEAHFDDGVPPGCVDLIHIPGEARLDIHVAALKQGVLALGSMSGAILFALAAGCPALTWGWRGSFDEYHEQNLLKTRFVYYPDIKASADDIYTLASGMIEGALPPPGRDMTRWNPSAYLHGRTRTLLRNTLLRGW